MTTQPGSLAEAETRLAALEEAFEGELRPRNHYLFFAFEYAVVVIGMSVWFRLLPDNWLEWLDRHGGYGSVMQWVIVLALCYLGFSWWSRLKRPFVKSFIAYKPVDVAAFGDLERRMGSSPSMTDLAPVFRNWVLRERTAIERVSRQEQTR